MFSFTFNLIVALLLAIDIQPAAAKSDFSLYAYGSNNDGTIIGGLPVIYVDGVAYIGLTKPTDVSIATNITYSPSSSDSTEWLISPANTSDLSSNATSTVSGSALALNTTSGAYGAVSFVDDTSSSDLTTSGFHLYGSTVLWASDSGAFESLFYAWPTDTDGLYVLRWNTDSLIVSISIPVALRYLSPDSDA